jgi:hypothetical protein
MFFLLLSENLRAAPPRSENSVDMATSTAMKRDATAEKGAAAAAAAALTAAAAVAAAVSVVVWEAA